REDRAGQMNVIHHAAAEGCFGLTVGVASATINDADGWRGRTDEKMAEREGTAASRRHLRRPVGKR
ncbi:MAG: hypothetical protein ACYTAO_18775, partial [Planctomycetota bacterium]